VEGTVIKMPEGCGDGTYAVAHAFHVSANQLNSRHDRTLGYGPIVELDMSYDFSLVERAKRDVNDVFIRVDYSNIPGYWNAMVDSPGRRQKKRSRIDKRFFSSNPEDWKMKFDTLPKNSRTPFTAYFETHLYDEVMLCDGQKDNQLKIRMSKPGRASGESRWGYTSVGTLRPFKLEQAYGFFDNDIELSVELEVKALGAIHAKAAHGFMFNSNIVGKTFDVPEIISFRPEFQVQVDLNANIELDASFNVLMETSTPDSFVQTFPSSVRDATGSTRNDIKMHPYGDSTGIQNFGEGRFDLALTPMMMMSIRVQTRAGEYGLSTITNNAGGFYGAILHITSDSECLKLEGLVTQALYQLYTLGSTSTFWPGEDLTRIVHGSNQVTRSLDSKCLKTESSSKRLLRKADIG